MNGQSNVMPESSLRSQGIAAVSIPAARLMYWSVRRELWEIRAIYVTPVAVACLFLFGFSISILHLLVKMHAAPGLDVMQQRELFGQPYEFAEDLIMGTILLVGLFYSADALVWGTPRSQHSVLEVGAGLGSHYGSVEGRDSDCSSSPAGIHNHRSNSMDHADDQQRSAAGQRPKRGDPLVARGDLPPLAYAALPLPVHSRALAIANLCLAPAGLRLGTARTDSLGYIAAADNRHRGEGCLQYDVFRFFDWQPLYRRLRRHRDHGTWQGNGSDDAIRATPFPHQPGPVDGLCGHSAFLAAAVRCADIAGPSDSHSGLIQSQASGKFPIIDGFIQSQGGPMESLVSLNCSEPVVCNSPLPTASIWQDVLAQAVTGELMAAMNYRALSTICDDSEEVADALEHAQGEQGTQPPSLPKAARSE